MTADPPSPADELASFVERGQKAQAATRFHIDENRLYRKIPILRRLIPSVRKRIRRIWPSGHTRPVRPVRLTGLDAPLIHIFGDSHSGLFAATPGAVIHYIGPVTMHKVGRDGVQVFGLDSVKVEAGDGLGFCFGEIDVRVHVANQRDRFSRQPAEVIRTLSAAYLSTLEAVQASVVSSPIIVISVVPPSGYRYPNYDQTYPRNGTDQERVAWTVQLNEILRRGARRAGFGFIDQYSPFANNAGLLDLRSSADGVHVTPDSLNCDIKLRVYLQRLSRKP